MLTLSLLRHAKSSWDDPAVEDFDRPLAKRGARAAPKVGAWLTEHKLAPSLVLCSGAIRTRATLALVLPELHPQPQQVLFDDALYLAGAGDLLQAVRAIKGEVRNAMLVGHNPGMHGLALSLLAKGDKADLTALAEGFPTAALAVLTFETSNWLEVNHATGRLEHFVTPKR